MLRGLWKLTWIETKVFLREPLGALGTIGIPVLVFVVVGRMMGARLTPASLATNNFIGVGLPVLAAVLIAISAVLSLVTIISIYREGGILKRLRATPLRPELGGSPRQAPASDSAPNAEKSCRHSDRTSRASS